MIYYGVCRQCNRSAAIAKHVLSNRGHRASRKGRLFRMVHVHAWSSGRFEAPRLVDLFLLARPRFAFGFDRRSGRRPWSKAMAVDHGRNRSRGQAISTAFDFDGRFGLQSKLRPDERLIGPRLLISTVDLAVNHGRKQCPSTMVKIEAAAEGFRPA